MPRGGNAFLRLGVVLSNVAIDLLTIWNDQTQYVLSSLQERSYGIDYVHPEPSRGETFVSVHDRGLLKRYRSEWAGKSVV